MITYLFTPVTIHILFFSFLTCSPQPSLLKYIFAFVFTREFQFHGIKNYDFQFLQFGIPCKNVTHSTSLHTYIVKRTYIHVVYSHTCKMIYCLLNCFWKKDNGRIEQLLYIYTHFLWEYIYHLDKVLRVCLCFCYNLKLSCTILLK